MVEEMEQYGCKCHHCDGTGTNIIWINSDEVADVPCEACDGTGWFSY